MLRSFKALRRSGLRPDDTSPKQEGLHLGQFGRFSKLLVDPAKPSRKSGYRFRIFGVTRFFGAGLFRVCAFGPRAMAVTGLAAAGGFDPAAQPGAWVWVAVDEICGSRPGLCDIGPHQFDKVPSPHTFGRCGRS